MTNEATLTGTAKARLMDFILRYDLDMVQRGREYVAEGRVVRLRRSDDGQRASASVQGTELYDVELGPYAGGSFRAHCTCPAFVAVDECKHVAALALVLHREQVAAPALRGSKPAAAPSGPPPAKEPFPEIFRHVYSASRFLSRLGLHAGLPVGDGLDRWSPLSDWWARSHGAKTPAIVAMRRHVLTHTAEIARDLETLRTWTPPAAPLPGTVFGQLYANLAERYLACRVDPTIFRCAPGPLDGRRHPGFDLFYDAQRGVFDARERRLPLGGEPMRLAFTLPLASRAEARFEPGVLQDPDRTDAWDLFALRAVLIALHARTEDAVFALEHELGRPVWDHVLEQLGNRTKPAIEVHDWAFVLLPTYRDNELSVVPFSRRRLASGKPSKWKKDAFEAAYIDESLTLEREIARVAMCSLERHHEARVTLGRPLGHELLRLLGRHPNVRMPPTKKADPENDPHAEIFAGDLAMRMDPGPDGALVPRFTVDGRLVDTSMLFGGESAGLRGARSGNTIVSVFVPPALRPWLDAAQSVGAAMSFPRESVPRLLTATEKLVSAGVAQLPRDALGVELPYEPAPALRVEWQPAGAAVVDVFITVHPKAPLVAAGKGPVLFTFAEGEQRYFVERDLAREALVAEDSRARIAAPVSWDHLTGHTDGLEDTLALAEYLDRNPLGLAIEIKVGKAPTVTSWEDASRTLDVERKGSWLVVGGALDVAGIKLTLGDVLDAARLAQRFVKAADGVFLELSKEAIEKLRPVAMATELGGAAKGEDARLHDAFGSILADARELFETVNGADLDAYVKRFEARDKRVRLPSLDHGTLRPYQREGVAWMLRLATWAPGCILADDMGLGKTVQTAAVLKGRASLGPQLIIAPASVSSNWMSELARFVPSLKARWYNDERDLSLAALGPGDVLVVSYGLLQRRSSTFEKQRFATVVVDEAQYVKNVSAQRTDAVRSIERDFTITLTGTPLENHLGELFSIVDLAFPGLLGTEATFRERFRKPIEGQHRDEVRLAVLGRLLSPFLLRRTRAKVLEELPEREEITEYIDLDASEQKRYLALRRACEQQFAKRKSGETAAQLKIALFAALTRLRQLACDVRLVDPTYTGPSSKIARAVELCVELAQEGNRALVFSQFTQFLGKLKPELEAAGLRVAYLAGDTPTAKRRAIVEAFQRGEYDVFCVSLLAGGTGLNLTSASYVIHTDPWWNPAAEEQATSRAHRMGQTEPVTVYRLVARGTIEEAVLAMHASKKDLASAVLEGKASAKAITSTELLDLLRFGE
ncbi:MAG: Superfamily helicase, family [Labilithrix sp.]|nr:Superfamily helicase, family [Labilithrix sp.]